MGCLELRAWQGPLSFPHSTLTIRGETQQTTQQVLGLRRALRAPGCRGAPVGVLGLQSKAPRAVLHRLDKRSVFSHSSGDQKSEIKELAGLRTFRSSRGGRFLSFPARGGCRRAPAGGHIPPSSALSSRGLLSSVSVSLLPSFTRAAMTGLRDQLVNPEYVHIEVLKSITST